MRVIFEWWPQIFSYETHGREATVAWEDQDTAKLKHKDLEYTVTFKHPQGAGDI